VKDLLDNNINSTLMFKLTILQMNLKLMLVNSQFFERPVQECAKVTDAEKNFSSSRKLQWIIASAPTKVGSGVGAWTKSIEKFTKTT